MEYRKDVHAPYHFVPLSKWNFMPSWANLVSHDVPFEDGLSGVITYSLKNKTPLCVGGHQVEQGKKDVHGKRTQPTLVQWARDPLGNPVIPSTSLKGMIRNVLEIATFGKFGSIDDHHYSFRDISNAETRYAREVRESDTQAYWLKFDAELKRWTLRRASHTVLFHDEFNKHTKCKIVNESHKQPAEEKYQKWPLKNDAISFDVAERRIEGTKGKMVKVARAAALGDGKLHGYPVFTSFRPGSKKYTSTRLNFSYLFYGEEQTVVSLPDLNRMANKLFDNHSESLVSYLKKNPHPQLGIPVFAKEKQGKILALGFAQMPRKLYDKSVKTVAHQTQKLAESAHVFDMAELMFGTIREKGFSLKSRVFFSDLSCDDNKGISTSSPAILGEPKASFLAGYLEQNGGKQAVVYNELSQYEANSTLKGWKYYPARPTFKAHLPQDLKNKPAVQTQLELMQAGSKFSGRIVFHNLKPEELGALLWALEWGGCEEAHHILGHGKPLGAGAVKVSVEQCKAKSARGEMAENSQAYIAKFKSMMEEHYPGKQWEESPQLQHLLAFANLAENEGKPLSYMPLQSKDYSVTTYTSALKGREKQVLPDWRHKGKSLSRNELFTNSDVGSAFGQGRLSALVEHCRNEGSLSTHEGNLFGASEQERKVAEKAEKFAAMSEQEQAFYALKEKLNLTEVKASKDMRQSYNNQIESLLDQCLAGGIEGDFHQEFHDMCCDKKVSAYLDLANNKRNKPKLNQRKEKLKRLEDKYGLQGQS
ncbi:CRISPR-associated RAMP family protein [Photobacterium proteolyticum]|uniref:CRISPR-associated RAMP family protein n=1 Tax=Photobacterium proteolyticum TaxID=1903952 RepID=A0A1Q9GIN9_9GAMM|nr:TIGR03986 family CRISPR-associated RAMP protein [Photobacterium proteolyticum]OLQ74321.1 CRISPR-associated RAMP family protein [Photobacterium proteolyticum]